MYAEDDVIYIDKTSREHAPFKTIIDGNDHPDTSSTIEKYYLSQGWIWIRLSSDDGAVDVTFHNRAVD